MCGAHLSCACVPPASVHAAHPTHFWHINREHVCSQRTPAFSGVWVEINVLKFKKTATLNIHSMFLFPFLLLELTEKLVAQDMQKQRKNRDTTWLRWTARYPNRMQPNGTCFFFFNFFISFSYKSLSWDEQNWRLNTASSPKVRYYLQSLTCC